MPQTHLIFLSIPGLRPCDIDANATPTLHRLASTGALAELVPTFPCVTSSVQASFWTGTPPEKHGVIANGFFHPSRREVEFWVARNDVVAGEQIWEALKHRDRTSTSAVWHAQNIKDAAADFIVTPAPIHEDDGTTRLWCYSKPDGLYQELLDAMGHFPLQHYWGPAANIKSTQWILRAATWLMEKHAPRFHWIYLPHLDYAAQKFGPNSPQAKASLVELDSELAKFVAGVDDGPLAESTTYLVAGEYALTDVSGVLYPNRLLREAGLLRVREHDGHELVDMERSSAFAMVDHQVAHVFINDNDSAVAAKVADLFGSTPGVAGAYLDDDRAKVGLNHERSGRVVLVAEESHWFAYYWWLDDAAAPAFARTVDIHQKPGYDPVELFFDPATKSIPLDATLVKGSHGAPATESHQRTALICSTPSAAVENSALYRDVDIKRIVLELMAS